jgi:hypothetical protein
MKQILVLLITLLLTAGNDILGIDFNKIEIECINLMTGKSVKYVVASHKVKIYKGSNEKFYFLVAFHKLPKGKIEKLNEIINEIKDSCGVKNITYRDPYVLDGLEWQLKIQLNENLQTIKIINCYFKRLDDIIFIINEGISGKKRIPPTGRFYVNNKCLAQ